ncbi:MAG: hypothetical protein WC121_09470 [Candidatus Kapaibacterium sp.]
MKLLLSLLLLSLVPASIYADFSDERNYEDGPLTWYDFQGEPIKNEKITAQIRFLLEYHPEEVDRNDTSLVYIKTSNYFNKSAAWVSENEKTGLALSYFQILFDIREYYRQELEKELNQTDEIYNLIKLHSAYFEKGTNEIQRFNLESESGHLREVLLRWEAKYAQKLRETSRPVLPYVKDANWAFGGNVGINSSFNTGSMGEHLTNCYGFSYGGDLAYRDFILFLEISLVLGDIRKPFNYEEKWETNIGTGIAIFDVSLGYPIFDNSTHRLTPFFGLGIHELSPSSKAKELEDITLTNYGYIYGLCYDFNLSTTVYITPSTNYGIGQYSNNQSLRLRLFVTDVRHDVFKGSSINLSLAYSFYAKMVEVFE